MRVYLLSFLAIKILVDATSLDDYVNTFDLHYNFKIIQKYKLIHNEIYVINMTSQKWLNG